MYLRNMILGVAAAAVPVLAQAATSPTGDPVKGETTFKQTCGACHVMVHDGKPRPGPALQGLMGRKAGSAAGFNYSPAMKASKITWTPSSLDQFLNNPQAAVPGAFMSVKLANPMQRKDVLAYLAASSGKT